MEKQLKSRTSLKLHVLFLERIHRPLMTLFARPFSRIFIHLDDEWERMRIRVKVPNCPTFSQFDDLVYQSIEINPNDAHEEIGLKGLIAIGRTAPVGKFSLTCFFFVIQISSQQLR